MNKLNFRPALLTREAMKMKSWKGTEWFGVDWPYVPFWDAKEYNAAYGVYREEGISLNINDSFEFICVYFAGEFVCSFEPTIIPEENSIMTLKDLTLMKDYGK